MKTDKAICINELKVIQLDILKAVHEFCITNNIQYSLSDGTLLGAARHKGYIPWDDDIDIMMLRPDYDKFVKLFKHEVYEVFTSSLKSGYVLCYAKVVDVRTTLKEYSVQKIHMGVNIDIFPVDKIIDDTEVLEPWLRKRKLLDKLYNAKMVPFDLKFLKRSIRKLFYIIKYPTWTLKKLCKEIQNMSISYESDNCKYSGQLSFPDININRIFPSTIMNEYIDIEFEGYYFKCLKNFSEYLTIYYGDWNCMPPENERASHHIFQASWI